MKLKARWLLKTAGLLGATAIRNWMSTLDYRAAFYDPSVDPVNRDNRGQKIYVFWHEYILAPIYLRGHCNLAMLLSQHGDAEILGYAARHLGFECVRGSTTRGGAAAIRELLGLSQEMNLTITPDGPRGPRRRMSQGPIYLASRLGLPIVALGIGFDRPWRARSWDRFAIPKPGSRARSIVSPPLRIPANLDREGLERYRIETERMLNHLTEKAEAWAESGRRCELERPIRREGQARRMIREDAASLGVGPSHLPMMAHSAPLSNADDQAIRLHSRE